MQAASGPVNPAAQERPGGGNATNPALHPRLLETLVQAYWAPLVVFDPGWRVVVWSRGAQNLFGLSSEQAVGRSLEDTGILSHPSRGPMVRGRVEAGEDVMLAGEPAPGPESQRTVMHRFQTLTGGRGAALGFLCASSFRQASETLASERVAAMAERSRVGSDLSDLRKRLEALSSHAQKLAVEVATTPAASRAREIQRDVDQLIRGLDAQAPRVRAATEEGG